MRKVMDVNGETFRVEVRYQIGDGYKFTRGYYLHVQPITIERGENGINWERAEPIRGRYCKLLTVTRRSKKASDEAEGLATEELIGSIIEQIQVA